jgi:hypothetical protein
MNKNKIKKVSLSVTMLHIIVYQIDKTEETLLKIYVHM